ncbi:MAG: TonB-dependent receptor [Porticoccaceae bacterium]|nr:TonB-dependent receptor [Porticoccaceae bacterium]
MNIKRSLLHTSLTIAASALTVPALAQIEEILVTARKTEESLQQTPVAVTALTRETLINSGVTKISEIVRTTPTVTIANGAAGGPGTMIMSIRGQSKNEANSATDAAVAIYVNGVNYARMTSANFALFDIAQAEVLRGPQGTLFGRNTTGGALNVTTVQPGSEFGGDLTAGIGNFGSRRFEGGVDIPLTDELAMRIAGKYETNDGAFDNETTGKTYRELDKGWGARATLNWDPVDLPVTLSLMADKSRYKDNGNPMTVIGINDNLMPFGPALGTIGQAFANHGYDYTDFIYGKSDFDKTYGDPQTGLSLMDDPYDIGRMSGVSATLDWDIGDWHLKSITARRTNFMTNSLDMDGTPLRLLSFYSIYDQNQFSQELQLSTSWDDIDFIGGVFYFKEEGDERSISDVFGFTGLVPTGLNLSDIRSKSKAVFAQVNYNFTPKLRATVGYRYTWDDRGITTKARSGFTLNEDGSVASFTGSQGFDESFSYPAWVLGLDYRVNDDMFLYAKMSNASMAGGFNTRPVLPGDESFDPEEATDIEVGMKLDAFDGRLRTNIALFAIETQDLQRITSDVIDNRTTQATQNAGDARTYGVEFEGTALPWDGMEVKAAVVYLDSEYKDGTFIDKALTPDGVVFYDRSNERMSNAPEWVYTISATQAFELAVGTLSAHVSYTYTDDKSFSQRTAEPHFNAEQLRDLDFINKNMTMPGHGLWSGRLSLDIHNGVSVALWGQNLTDKEYFTHAFEQYSSVGFAVRSPGMPKAYGVDVRYQF